jgi:hypothetical protein
MGALRGWAVAGPEVLLSLLPEVLDYTRTGTTVVRPQAGLRWALLGRKALQTSLRVSR